MSKKIVHNESANIPLFANDITLGQFKNDSLFFQTESTSINPQVDPQSALLMERIDDLKIKSDSGATVKAPSKVISDRSIKEVLFDACADVKILTSNVSMHLNPEMRQKLFNQLDLIHDPESWDPDEDPVSKPSFNSFLRWFLMVSPKRGPGLGVTYSGNIVAAWVDEKDRLILEFLPNDKSKWSVTKYLDGEVERSSGQTNILRLPEVLSPYDVDNFFKSKD